MTVVLSKFGLSYVSTPKIACTSLKTMFFEIENEFPFRPFATNGRMRWIHAFYPTLENHQLPRATMENHRRLTMVRDPIRRLLSCYSNRVLHHKELSARSAGAALDAAGLKPDPDLSTFVAELPRYMAAASSIHHHAQPMVNYIGTDPKYYERVYKMSEMALFHETVEAHTGRKASLEHLQRGGPKIDVSALSAKEIAWLKQFYAVDYEVYGAYLD